MTKVRTPRTDLPCSRISRSCAGRPVNSCVPPGRKLDFPQSGSHRSLQFQVTRGERGNVRATPCQFLALHLPQPLIPFSKANFVLLPESLATCSASLLERPCQAGSVPTCHTQKVAPVPSKSHSRLAGRSSKPANQKRYAQLVPAKQGRL